MNLKQRQLISTYFPELKGALLTDSSPALDTLLTDIWKKANKK